MSRLVKDGKKQPVIRDTAARLVQGLSSKNYAGEIARLFYFVRDKIRYTRDINGVETLHIPSQVLAQEYGDCDDKSVLLASLLEAIGHRTRFLALGFQPNEFSHVITQTRIREDTWLSLDPTENQPIGWFPPGVVARMAQYN
jgi:transglutaminase-like putative cysteine protease